MISFLLFLQLFSSPLPASSLMSGPVANHVSVSDTLYWSPEVVLSWDDFHAEAPASNPFAAYTFTIITLEYHATISGNTVKPSFKIKAAFNRSKSWAHPQAQSRTDVILAHEKAHFDIAEITARKLRKSFSDKTFQRQSYKNEIDKTYDRILDEGEKMQERYDLETDHSRIPAAQEKWLNFVKTGLAALDAYK